LNGHFTRFLAQGLQAAPGTGNNFGVTVVQLVE
jgi:hypothetical protein